MYMHTWWLLYYNLQEVPTLILWLRKFWCCKKGGLTVWISNLPVLLIEVYANIINVDYRSWVFVVLIVMFF